jgi:hypothetical protein
MPIIQGAPSKKNAFAPFAIALAILLLCHFASFASAEDDAASAFRRYCAEKASASGDAMAVAGVDGWLFLANELRHIGVGPFWGEPATAASRARPQDADPLPVILDFKAQLDGLGIELILLPVPPKAVIFPDMLPDKVTTPVDSRPPPRLDATHQDFYQLLRENGVEVLDLTEVFLASRITEEGPAYCLQDSHWSGVGCILAAGLVAEIIRERDWYEGVRRTSFNGELMATPITGDLSASLVAGSLPGEETLQLRKVTTAEGELVIPDPDSPVILLGDSHNLVFHAGGDMLASGAGLADQLALELGFAVDLLAVRGSGATPARINLYRRSSSQPGYLDGKKVVVWCFAAREFTEGQGWRIVPVKRAEDSALSKPQPTRLPCLQIRPLLP